MTPLDAGAAAQLVGFGLQPKLRPAADATYGELVERHRTDVAFRDVVEHVADGLGLAVLDCHATHGIVMAPHRDSPFAQRLGDYRANMKVTDRLLHGLIHIGIAAYAYPTPAALLDEDVRMVAVGAVERFLRDACTRLAEQAGTADPDADAPETEQAWRLYLRRQAARDTGDGRRAAATTTGMIAYALEHLAAGGFVTRTGEEDGGTYRVLHRYRIGVRELAAGEAYRMIADAARHAPSDAPSDVMAEG